MLSSKNITPEKNNKVDAKLFFVLLSIIIWGFQFWVRSDSIFFVDTFESTKFLALAFNLILLPDWIKNYRNQLNFYPVTAGVLVLFSVLGFISKWIPFIEYFLYLPVLPLLFVSFRKLDLKSFAKTLPLYIIFCIGFTLLYYSNEDAQSPVPFESIISGQIHVDNMFHSSLANIIDTYGVPSHGFNGINFVHYHWGSHFLFVGLVRLINVHVISFYNYAYPIVFLPLFMKSLLDLLIVIKTRIFEQTFDDFFFTRILLIFTLFFSINWFQPFWLISESNTIACIFAFGLISFIIEYFYSHRIKTIEVYLISFLFLWIMITFKVSIGLTLSSALLVMLLIYNRNWKLKMLSLISFIILALFMYKVTLVNYHEGLESLITSNWRMTMIYLLRSNTSFWKFSNGIFHYMLGLGIFLGITLYWQRFGKPKNQFTKIFFQSVAILSFISLLLAFYSSGLNGSRNAWYFCYLQLIIGLVLVTIFLESSILQWIETKDFHFWSLLIAGFCLISTKGLIDNGENKYRDIFYYNRLRIYCGNLQRSNPALRDFIERTIVVNPIKGNIYYADSSQSWLYKSQFFRFGAQAYLVQAISGNPGVAMVSKNSLENGYPSDGLRDYRNEIINPYPNLKEAQSFARREGFNTLTQLISKDDSLFFIIHELK